jgi:hypothetical protein
MDLRQARELTGLSEKTLRRLIHEGVIQGELIGSGPNRHWEVTEESLDGLGRKEDRHSAEDERPESGQDCSNCEWLKEQLGEKDKQIEQLHVLLQRSQEQFQKVLPAPQGRRWWWPWG